jgi:hypothetical protein
MNLLEILIGLLRREIGPSDSITQANIDMHQTGFEPTIPEFEWTENISTLDRAATEVGTLSIKFNLESDLVVC